MPVITPRRTAASDDRSVEQAVVWLSDPRSADRQLAGSKAANLATARGRGLPVVEGFAITTSAVAAGPQAPPPQVRPAWERLTAGGRRPLAVRSSAPDEDLATGSRAGVYESVVQVRGWDDFVRAYQRVVASASGGPMAVLVQHHLDPVRSGVAFGRDPVSGRADRAVIVAVDGGPQLLVAGAVQGRRVVVDRVGRVRQADGDPDPVLDVRTRRRLLRTLRRTAAAFGGPQDIEWALDGRRLVLLQSRPVSTLGAVATGPLLGPGPVAETFPHPLSPLEQDLWLPPLRDAAIHVLALTGAAGRRRLRRSPVVTAVADQAVCDLELLGASGAGRRTLLARLDPRPPMRRLRVAWRMGRLRGVMGALARRLVDEVDAELRAIGALDVMDDEELLALLANGQGYLRSLHGHEMLVGALVEDVGCSGAELAMATAAYGRALGWSDEDLIAKEPTVLALTAPTLRARRPLPPVAAIAVPDQPLALREQLRLRVRWIHELTRAAVRELGRRLEHRGAVPAEAVPRLALDDLAAAVRGARVEVPPATPFRTPVPARFRLTADGGIVAETDPGASAGVGAGGGRGSGPVAFEDPPPGGVLVVRTLAPELAPLLPRLAGLVAETGSPLSHLAILAREHDVPVVVGHTTIRDLVEPGTVVVVDGHTGSVELVSVEAEVES